MTHKVAILCDTYQARPLQSWIMPAKSKKAVLLDEEEVAAKSAQPARKKGNPLSKFSTFPVPRRVAADPVLTNVYVKPGHLQFVNGNDKRFLTQSLDWSGTWPDPTRPYYDEEERKSALPPTSWPPNFVLLAPEQQYQGTVTKPVHGGWTWPGHPAPRLPTAKGTIQGLPGPLKKFFSS